MGRITMSVFYDLAMFFMAASLVGIFAYEWLIRKKSYKQFDEMQRIGIGKAYKAGFFTVVILIALVTVLDLRQLLPGEPALWYFSVLAIGMLVWCLTAIHYDAFMGVGDKLGRVMVCSLISIALMGLSSCFLLMSDVSGKMELMIITAVFVSCQIIEIVALLIHHSRGKAVEAE